MELLPTIDPKDKVKDRPLDGFGVALVATTKVLTTRTGADQEIAYNPLNHDSPLEMTMPWIHPLSFAKRPTIKNVKSTAKQADVSNVENKATLFMIVQTRNHMFVRLVLSRFKMTTNL